MSRRGRLVSIASLALAIPLAGCGAAIQSVIDPRADAATVSHAAASTAKVAGYRIRGTMTLDTGDKKLVIGLSGSMNTVTGVGSEIERVPSGRHTISLHDLYRGGTDYLDTRTLPGFTSQRVGARYWLKVDEGQALGLPQQSANEDPAEFIDFLKTPGLQVKDMGQASADGATTTLYQATIDLNRYAAAARPSRRPLARKVVGIVERALGSHVLTEDVWVDQAGLIRQFSYGFTECVDGNHLTTSMLVDFSRFGPQPKVALPRASHTRDLTRDVRGALKRIKQLPVACSAATQA